MSWLMPKGELPRMPTLLFLCSGTTNRSRYAEIVSTPWRRASKTDWLATSAGLCPSTSPTTRPYLAHRSRRRARSRHGGLEPIRGRATLPGTISPARRPSLRSKESEHRTILAARFPEFVDRVVYWKSTTWT